MLPRKRKPQIGDGGCRLVWSRLIASGAIDPGSNPGSPTILELNTYDFLEHSPLFYDSTYVILRVPTSKFENLNFFQDIRQR